MACKCTALGGRLQPTYHQTRGYSSVLRHFETSCWVGSFKQAHARGVGFKPAPGHITYPVSTPIPSNTANGQSTDQERPAALPFCQPRPVTRACNAVPYRRPNDVSTTSDSEETRNTGTQLAARRRCPLRPLAQPTMISHVCGSTLDTLNSHVLRHFFTTQTTRLKSPAGWAQASTRPYRSAGLDSSQHPAKFSGTGLKPASRLYLSAGLLGSNQHPGRILARDWEPGHLARGFTTSCTRPLGAGLYHLVYPAT
jgi:hypothetical protein